MPWERTPWNCSDQIQAIVTVPQRLCFSAQLSNCNVATCWNAVPVSTLHLSFKIQSSKCFGCSIKFFHLGLAKCNTTEPGLMKEGIGLGVRCIGLHGLVCHAMTFACWFRFLSLGVEVGWLFLCRKECNFQNSLEEDFFVVVVCWCRTSWHQISNYQLYHFVCQGQSGICVIMHFQRIWMLGERHL